MHDRLVVCLVVACASLTPSVANGQHVLGTFRWQLTPFCNVITLDVTQQQTSFSLDGFDDQCGAAGAADHFRQRHADQHRLGLSREL